MQLSKWKLATCVDCESEDYGRAVDGEHLCVECIADYGWDPYALGANVEDVVREESHSDADPGL